MPMKPPIRYPNAARKATQCGLLEVEGRAGCGGMRRVEAAEVKNLRCSAPGLGGHVIPNWELHSYLWELIGSHRKQSSCGRTGANGFAGALWGALRVNVLIHRGLREKAELEPLDTNARGVRCLSGLCSVSVR
jgi:hypothetical protein